MTQLYVCSTTEANRTRRRDTLRRLSDYCLIAALVLTIVIAFIAIVVGDPSEMLPPFELSLTPFGCFILFVVTLWVIGGLGRIGVSISRKISK